MEKMLIKELGFNLVLSEIFRLKNTSENNLEKSKYLNGDLNNLSVREDDGYRAIKDYVCNPNNEIRLEMMNGIMATFAYKNTGLMGEISDGVKKAILKQKDFLFDELDKLFPDLKKHLNQQQYQVCQSLMKMRVSYDLVDSLASHHFRTETIFKKGDFYGLKNLLPAIAHSCPKEFEDWYLKTGREDLKAVFINSFLDFDFNRIFHSFSKFSSEYFIESRSDVLRFYSILMKIRADRLSGGISIEKSKSLISEERVAKKDKLYLTLYSFKFSRFDQKDDLGNKSLDDDIKFFSDIFNSLDKKITLEFCGRIDNIILAEAIGQIKDRKKKLGLLAVIIYKLNSRFIKNRRPAIHDFLKANLHGHLLKEFGEKRGAKLEKLFDTNLKKINEPYFYYRHNDLWSESISRAMYCLIMIFVFYHSKDSSKISVYKNKFLAAKGNFYHYLSKEFDEMLDQIK